MPKLIGLVYYEDDPEQTVFRWVYPTLDDSELDDPRWVTEGCDPARRAVMRKVQPDISTPTVQRSPLGAGFVTNWVPTPPEAVEAMLDLAGVGPDDTLIDLGCGDGRILVAAARRGARAVGIDLDPQRLEESRQAVEEAGVADRVELAFGDLLRADLLSATVVTMFLTGDAARKVAQIPMRPGTRVVAHNSDMGLPAVSERSVGDCRLQLWVM